MLSLVNEKFGLKRNANVIICRAMGLLVQHGKDHDDIVQMAQCRLGEGWLLIQNHGTESTIRLKAFDSALDRAKEEEVADDIRAY
mgnify:CR=1 FL=1